VLGHVEGDAEETAQLGPPRVQHLSFGQGGATPGAAARQARARRVSGHLRVEDEVVYPDHAVERARRGAPQFAGRRAPQGRMPEQAQRNAVEGAAGRGLTEVRYRPASEAAIKEHATEGLVARLAAVAGPATDVETPAVLENGLRAVRARSWLLGAVGADHGGGHEIRVTVVDTAHTHDTPAPHELARAPSQHGEMAPRPGAERRGAGREPGASPPAAAPCAGGATRKRAGPRRPGHGP
jgi:hypothetical protein